jgi:hypothetical protein
LRAGRGHFDGLNACVDNDKVIAEPMHLVKFTHRHGGDLGAAGHQVYR